MTAEQKENLKSFQLMIEHHLSGIERLLETVRTRDGQTSLSYKLTLMARCMTPGVDGDILLTTDDIGAVITAIRGITSKQGVHELP